MRVACADHRILEEIGRRNVLEAAGGSRDARHRNRTTFSREQSAALEQGSRHETVSKQKETISELTDHLQTPLCRPPNQSFLTATTQTPTPERSWQPRSDSRRTPSRYREALSAASEMFGGSPVDDSASCEGLVFKQAR